MKNSIILQAIRLGFDFETIEMSYEITQAIADFFSENRDKLEVYEEQCEITSHSRGQDLVYKSHVETGEIVNFSDHWHKAPDTKVFVSDTIEERDGKMVRVDLYYLVGETDYNVPEGYVFDRKTKSHVKIKEYETNN